MGHNGDAGGNGGGKKGLRAARFGVYGYSYGCDCVCGGG